MAMDTEYLPKNLNLRWVSQCYWNGLSTLCRRFNHFKLLHSLFSFFQYKFQTVNTSQKSSCHLSYKRVFSQGNPAHGWYICCRSNQTLGQFVPTQVNLFQPRSVRFNLGQFASTQVNLFQPRSICFLPKSICFLCTRSICFNLG